MSLSSVDPAPRRAPVLVVSGQRRLQGRSHDVQRRGAARSTARRPAPLPDQQHPQPADRARAGRAEPSAIRRVLGRIVDQIVEHGSGPETAPRPARASLHARPHAQRRAVDDRSTARGRLSSPEPAGSVSTGSGRRSAASRERGWRCGCGWPTAPPAACQRVGDGAGRCRPCPASEHRRPATVRTPCARRSSSEAASSRCSRAQRAVRQDESACSPRRWRATAGLSASHERWASTACLCGIVTLQPRSQLSSTQPCAPRARDRSGGDRQQIVATRTRPSAAKAALCMRGRKLCPTGQPTRCRSHPSVHAPATSAPSAWSVSTKPGNESADTAASRTSRLALGDQPGHDQRHRQRGDRRGCPPPRRAAASAPSRKPVRPFLDGRAPSLRSSAGHDRDAVGLFDAQLGGVADHRLALGLGGGDRQRWGTRRSCAHHGRRPRSSPRSARARTTRSATGSPPSSRGRRSVDLARPSPPDVEQAGAVGLTPTHAHRQLVNRARAAPPPAERRPRRSRRGRSASSGCSAPAGRQRDAPARASRRARPMAAQHALGVVARRAGLDHGGRARRHRARPAAGRS